MGENHQFRVRAFVRAAKAQSPSDLKAPLFAILTGQFTTNAMTGRILVGTLEFGGSVSFALPPGFGSSEVMALAEEAIERLDNQPDPNNLPPRQPDATVGGSYYEAFRGR